MSVAGGLHAPYAHAFQLSITPVLTVAPGNCLVAPGSWRAFRNVILLGFDSMHFVINDELRKSENSHFINI